jgi:hypothetical protein
VVHLRITYSFDDGNTVVFDEEFYGSKYLNEDLKSYELRPSTWNHVIIGTIYDMTGT